MLFQSNEHSKCFTYLPQSPIHTHIHTLMVEAAMQGASCVSGAIWGSVSCSRTLQHAAQLILGETGFEPQTYLGFTRFDLAHQPSWGLYLHYNTATCFKVCLSLKSTCLSLVLSALRSCFSCSVSCFILVSHSPLVSDPFLPLCVFPLF